MLSCLFTSSIFFHVFNVQKYRSHAFVNPIKSQVHVKEEDGEVFEEKPKNSPVEQHSIEQNTEEMRQNDQRISELLNELRTCRASYNDIFYKFEKEKEQHKKYEQQTNSMMEELNNKDSMFQQEKLQLSTQLNKIIADYNKLKTTEFEDKNQISILQRENKVLKAQLNQLKAGVSQNQRYQSKNDAKLQTSNTNKTRKSSKYSSKVNKSDDVYDVQKLLDDKMENGTRLFLIQWKGYDDKTWEKESNLNCPRLLKKYLDSKQK